MSRQTHPKTILLSAANNYVPLTVSKNKKNKKKKSDIEANIRYQLCSAEACPHMKNVSPAHNSSLNPSCCSVVTQVAIVKLLPTSERFRTSSIQRLKNFGITFEVCQNRNKNKQNPTKHMRIQILRLKLSEPYVPHLWDYDSNTKVTYQGCLKFVG